MSHAMYKNRCSPHLLLAQILLPALLSSTDVSAQQTGDPDFNPPIIAPAFATGKGPVVLIDEAHHNFHTADGRYRALADLLRRDGYVVRGIDSRFSRTNLDGADMLVIANALHERNEEDWSLPTPSALDDGEIEAVVTWVADGGALLLIADHMPFPGATARLAEHFGILFANGFALRADSTGQIRFLLSDLTLRPHAITRGRTRAEAIDSVTSFT